MNKNKVHLSRDQIQSFLDQNQDKSVSDSLKRHLENCPACQEKFEKELDLVTRLEKLPELSLGKDLSSPILAELQRQNQTKRGITWIIIVEAIAAGLIIGALIPAINLTTWLPTFSSTRQELLVSVNIFLTQLASTWIYWWSELQLDIRGLLESLQSQANFSLLLPSPWILILTAVCIGVLVNYLLLRNNPIKNHNHQT
jgi:hypothetical protein